METVAQPKSRRDTIAGAIFIVIGLAFGWAATGYPLGRALKMGPGFIPLTLAVLMAVLGIAVIVMGLRRNDTAEAGPVPFKAILLTLAALAIFGYGSPRLGLVPTTFLCSFIVSVASVRNTVVGSLVIAAMLTVVAWVVFKIGLGVTLPTIGPLLSF